MQILAKVNRIFDRKTKVKTTILLLAIIGGALLETLALAIISPLIAILLNSSMIETNKYVKFVYDLFGFSNTGTFLALLTFLLAGIYIFRGIYLYSVSRIKFRFIARRQAELSGKLLSKILGYSYLYHTSKNPAELQRIIRTDVAEMFGLLLNVLQFLADVLMSLFIVVFLMSVSPTMTLCVLAMVATCILIYFKVFRKKIRAAGEKNRKAQIGMSKAIYQALGGIKEIKMLRRESYFYHAFMVSSDESIKYSTQYRTLDAVPKLVIDSVCFGGTFILVGALILGGADIAKLVPQISVFVLAAFRLLPAMTRLVNEMNSILHNLVAVDAVYKSLFEEEDDLANVPPPMVTLPDSVCDIIVRDVTFRYPTVPDPVLENITLTISNKKSAAFIGPSGAGKTTLADLILGILVPKSGTIIYDGKSVHQNFDDWSQHVGYIPQHIYLLDESIRKNVAFGIDNANIDEGKVWRALEQAQLADFVRSLPDGMETIVGDRGVRLSGGQRQRIGIARAIYEDPPILVLDEATSSLDNETEKAVMDAVMGFQGNKTMLIVAHRLTTIEHCDMIYKVENRKVIKER